MDVRPVKQPRDVRYTQLVEAITTTTARTGYPPTVRELCEEMHLSSVAYVSRLLHLMRDAGVIEFSDKKARTLKVTDAFR